MSSGYLHSRNPPVIYHNLKPTNVLIEVQGCVIVRALLSDIGKSYSVFREATSSASCIAVNSVYEESMDENSPSAPTVQNNNNYHHTVHSNNKDTVARYISKRSCPAIIIILSTSMESFLVRLCHSTGFII